MKFFNPFTLYLKRIIWSIWQFIHLKPLLGLSRLPSAPCQPIVYLPSTDFAPKHIFNSKFRGKNFHFVVRFFKKKGRFSFIPLSGPLLFFVWVPFYLWKKGGFFCRHFVAFFLGRFIPHSLRFGLHWSLVEVSAIENKVYNITETADVLGWSRSYVISPPLRYCWFALKVFWWNSYYLDAGQPEVVQRGSPWYE